jgi:hypothetical protein
VTVPLPSFEHLRRLTDEGGLYEHALGTTPRPEHGYCVDDVARALVVVAREGDEQADLLGPYLDFVLAAQVEDGRFRNRRAADLSWTDEPSLEDCWGRALWGLGAVVASDAEPRLRAAAFQAFERGVQLRSPWTHAMAFAALGAIEVLHVFPQHRLARELLRDAALLIGRPLDDNAWPWPQPRLSYANAALAEVLLAAGSALERPELVADALMLLGWLVAVQTREGHLSVVPVGGRGKADSTGGFDQQPIEVAALADACARAYAVTGETRWLAVVDLAAAWFLGENDASTPLYDPATGGGCDGLEPHGRNENQGAESTLALISTWQQARALALCLR